MTAVSSIVVFDTTKNHEADETAEANIRLDELESLADEYVALEDLRKEAFILSRNEFNRSLAHTPLDIVLEELSGLDSGDAEAGILVALGLANNCRHTTAPVQPELVAAALRLGLQDKLSNKLAGILSNYIANVGVVTYSATETIQHLLNLEKTLDLLNRLPGGDIFKSYLCNVVGLKLENMLTFEGIGEISSEDIAALVHLKYKFGSGQKLLDELYLRYPYYHGHIILAILETGDVDKAIGLYEEAEDGDELISDDLKSAIAIAYINKGDYKKGLDMVAYSHDSDVLDKVYEAYLAKCSDEECLSFCSEAGFIDAKSFMKGIVKLKPNISNRLMLHFEKRDFDGLLMETYIIELDKYPELNKRQVILEYIELVNHISDETLALESLVILGLYLEDLDLMRQINTRAVEMLRTMGPKYELYYCYNILLTNLIKTPDLINKVSCIKFFENLLSGEIATEINGKLAQIYYKLGEKKKSDRYVKLIENKVDTLSERELYLLGDCYVGVGRIENAITLGKWFMPRDKSEYEKYRSAIDFMRLSERIFGAVELTPEQKILFTNNVDEYIRRGGYLSITEIKSGWLPSSVLWGLLPSSDRLFILDSLLRKDDLDKEALATLCNTFIISEDQKYRKFLNTLRPYFSNVDSTIDIIKSVNPVHRKPLIIMSLDDNPSEEDIFKLLDGVEADKDLILSVMEYAYSWGGYVRCMRLGNYLTKKGIPIEPRYAALSRLAESYRENVAGYHKFTDLYDRFGDLEADSKPNLLYTKTGRKPSINFVRALVYRGYNNAVLRPYYDMFTKDEWKVVKEQLAFGNKGFIVKYFGRYLSKEYVRQINSLSINFSGLVRSWMTSSPCAFVETVKNNINTILHLERVRPGSVSVLHEMFGISCFGRYPSDVLINQYDERERTDDPYGVFVFGVYDHGKGVFYLPELKEVVSDLCKELRSHKLLVRIVEAGSRPAYARRFIALDRLYGSKRSPKMSLRTDNGIEGNKISYVVNFAHGDEDGRSFNLGTLEGLEGVHIDHIVSAESIRLSKCFKDGAVVGNYMCYGGNGIAEAQSNLLSGSKTTGAPRLVHLDIDKMAPVFDTNGKLDHFEIVSTQYTGDASNKIFVSSSK